MLYLVYGDHDAAREKARSLASSLLAKRPDAHAIRVESDDADAAHVRSLPATRGLFGEKVIAVLDGLFSGGFLDGLLGDLRDSENVFILVESGLSKDEVAEVAPHAEKMVSCEASEGELGQEFNLFALADAFGTRDKKKLWGLFARAVRAGASAEEIHGILFWQAKSLAFALSAENAADAGMKQFPFSKAKRFLKNFSPDDVRALPGRLVSLLHDARREGIPLDAALERFILSL